MQEHSLHKEDFYKIELEKNLRGIVIQFQHTVCAIHSRIQRIAKNETENKDF